MKEVSTIDKKNTIERYQSRGVRNHEIASAIHKISKTVEKVQKSQPSKPEHSTIVRMSDFLFIMSMIGGTIGATTASLFLGAFLSPAYFSLILILYPLINVLIASQSDFMKPRFFWTKKMRKNLQDNIELENHYELQCASYKCEIDKMIEKLAPQLQLINDAHPTLKFSINPKTGELVVNDNLRPTEALLVENLKGIS